MPTIRVRFDLVGGSIAEQVERNNLLVIEFKTQFEWLIEAYNFRVTDKKFGKVAAKRLRAWVKQAQREAGYRWWRPGGIRVSSMTVTLKNAAGGVMAEIDVFGNGTEWYTPTEV